MLDIAAKQLRLQDSRRRPDPLFPIAPYNEARFISKDMCFGRAVILVEKDEADDSVWRRTTRSLAGTGAHYAEIVRQCAGLPSQCPPGSKAFDCFGAGKIRRRAEAQQLTDTCAISSAAITSNRHRRVKSAARCRAPGK